MQVDNVMGFREKKGLLIMFMEAIKDMYNGAIISLRKLVREVSFLIGLNKD